MLYNEVAHYVVEPMNRLGIWAKIKISHENFFSAISCERLV